MRYLLKTLIVLVFSLALASCSDPAEPEAESTSEPAAGKQGNGQFKDDRVWPGMAEGKCGAKLQVVSVDGGRAEYWPPNDLFQQLEHEEIIQNEVPRPAAGLEAVLDRYAAGQVQFVACDGNELTLDRQMLSERRGFLVLTGRGPLKLIAEQEGQYFTVLRLVREIRFAEPVLVGPEQTEGDNSEGREGQ